MAAGYLGLAGGLRQSALVLLFPLWLGSTLLGVRRVRTVLILYTADVIGGAERPGDDAIALEWYPLEAPPPDIAFASHRQALAEYRERLAAR